MAQLRDKVAHTGIVGFDGTNYYILATDTNGQLAVNNYVWNAGSLTWEKETQPGGGSSTEYADGAARGTATGTLAMGDDGTNIQSVKVDSAGELQVDIVGSLPAGTNAIGKLAANSGVDIGDVDITSIAAGTNTIGQVGIVPVTTGGLSIYRNLDLDETGINIKGSAGQVYGGFVYNAAAAVTYLKFYNKATAPTVGTDTPVVTIPLPATSLIVLGALSGITFGTGIGVGAVTGLADNSTGAPAANDCVVNIFYK